MNIVTGGALDVPVEKGEGGWPIGIVKIMTVSTSAVHYPVLVLPQDTDRVVIGEGRSQVRFTGEHVGTGITAETVERHGAVVTGETKTGDTLGLFRRGLHGAAGVKGICGRSDLVIPQRGIHNRGVGIVGGVTGKTNLTVRPPFAGEIMNRTRNLRRRRTCKKRGGYDNQNCFYPC